MPHPNEAFGPLADLRAWMPWRWCGSEANPKKMPCRCRRGAGTGHWYEPECLGTLAEATLRAGSWAAGVGVLLGPLPQPMQDWRLAGIDLDRCRSPAGTLTPWAHEVLAALGTLYWA